MANCPICGAALPTGKKVGQECLDNWNTMRGIISQRLQAQHGEATRETQPIMHNEMKRLDTLWKRDRAGFEKEVNTWY